MALNTFRRSVAPVSKIGAAAGAFGLAGASLFAASPAVAAEFECDAVTGLPAPVLVADGVCEIVITSADAPDEDPTTFTFPASMGKIQAVVVGAGGGGAVTDETTNDGYDYGAYGGGGGEVAFVDEVALDTPIDIVIGLGGANAYNDYADDGGETIFAYDSVDEVVANGGYGATPYGGGDLYVYGINDEFYGDSIYLDYNYDIYYHLGGGAGAAGDAVDEVPGPGFLLSELVSEFGADADLFPASADSSEYGLGGAGALYADVEEELPVGVPTSSGDLVAAASATSPASASGQGGNALFSIDVPLLSPPYPAEVDATDGSDGAVILRYGAEELAATGADATPALAAGAVAAAAGAGLVGVATLRRRRATV